MCIWSDVIQPPEDWSFLIGFFEKTLLVRPIEDKCVGKFSEVLLRYLPFNLVTFHSRRIFVFILMWQIKDKVITR